MNQIQENNDIDFSRENFAISSRIIINELHEIMEKTKKLEIILRSELGECAFNKNVVTSKLQDPCSSPPRKRTKYE
jgi:hypothetical protein